MKIFLFILLFFNSFLRADIFDNSPAVLINMKISNIDDYPDIKFMVCNFEWNPVLYTMPEKNFDGYVYPFGCQELKQNQVLKGRRPNHNTRRIFAFPKSFYESVEMNTTLQSHPVNVTSNQTLENDILHRKSVPVLQIQYMRDKEYPVDVETRVYKIVSVINENITLKLEKRIIHFTNDEDNKTINY